MASMNKIEAERYQWNWQHFQGRKFESRESKTIVQVVLMFVQENNGTYNVLCTVDELLWKYKHGSVFSEACKSLN